MRIFSAKYPECFCFSLRLKLKIVYFRMWIMSILTGSDWQSGSITKVIPLFIECKPAKIFKKHQKRAKTTQTIQKPPPKIFFLKEKKPKCMILLADI